MSRFHGLLNYEHLHRVCTADICGVQLVHVCYSGSSKDGCRMSSLRFGVSNATWDSVPAAYH